MKCIVNNSNDPYFNLAFEEFCLDSFQGGETCFLLWRNNPSVIIGKNQNLFQEVDFQYAEKNGINLVRRITGGGAVYHDLGNLNISIIGNYELYPDYAEVYGEFITEALRRIGLKGVEMNGRNDLYVDGKKISGWAKRIHDNSFLLHGTLLYDVDLDQLERVLQTRSSKMQRKAVQSVKSVVQNIRELLPYASLDELKNALEKEMRGDDEVIRLDESQLEQINRLVTEKYKTDQWIYNLTFTPTISQTFHASCGCIVLNVLLENNRIAALHFRGDFLGNKDTEGLSGILRGVDWSEDSIREALCMVRIDDYFSGLTNEEFLEKIAGLMH